MMLRGAIDADEEACLLLEGGPLDFLALAQAIRDAQFNVEPTEIPLGPLQDMANASPLKSIVIQDGKGLVQVAFQEDYATLKGSDEARQAVAYSILDFIYYGDFSEFGEHAHIDVDDRDSPLGEGSRNIMLIALAAQE